MTDVGFEVVTRHRVLMVDVDLVQVNFAAFFRWMDHGYNALLAELGNPLSQVIRQGFATPVVDARCSYRRPVTLDDEFDLTTRVVEAGRTSYRVSHVFADGQGVFAVGRCTHVWVRRSPSHEAEPVPSWIRAIVGPGIIVDGDLDDGRRY